MQSDKEDLQRSDERYDMGSLQQSRSSTETCETVSLRENPVNARGEYHPPEANSGIPYAGIVPPPNAHQPLSIQEEIRRFVRQELSQQAEAEGNETFDEADDFEEEDPDIIPLTHHEVVAMTDAELMEYGLSQGYEISNDPLDLETKPEPAEAGAMPEARSGDGSEESERPSN